MMHVFDSTLNIYRRTVKRFRPIHVAVHGVMSHGFIPLLETATNFRTMPDDPFWFRLELLTGRHERETLRQIEQRVKPGMVMLDIGAHVGYYARRGARLVGAGGRIFAFEPHPRTFETLRYNVAGLNCVTPVQAAAAEAGGSAELYDYLMMSASGSLHYDPALVDLQRANTGTGDIAPRIGRDFKAETFTVRTVAIDDFLQQQNIPQVDLVKMDIEGAEIGALRGMKHTIQQSPNLTLIMEYNPQALKAFDLKPEDAVSEVMGFGFQQLYVIERDASLTELTGDADALARLTSRLMQHMDVVNLLLTR